MPSLLAVDLGLRTGLALFGEDGRLRWYRSQNFGSTPRLRRGAQGIFVANPEVAVVVLEGGGPLAGLWEKEAEKRGVRSLRIGAEGWRQQLLIPREQRTGAIAKHSADAVARRVIEWSGATRPTSLRHDAAEAILVGLWGVVRVGWLDAVPEEVRRA